MNRRREVQASPVRGKIPFLVAVLAMVGVAGVALGLKRQDREVLRRELETVQLETRELAALREENQRLRQLQIPVTDLERLRTDHTALTRLRAELESLGTGPAGIR